LGGDTDIGMTSGARRLAPDGGVSGLGDWPCDEPVRAAGEGL